MKALTKTGLLVFALTVIGLQMASAQNRIIRNQGIYYTLEGFAGYGLGMKTDYPLVDVKNDYTPYNMGIRTSINMFVDYHISVGAGLAFNQYKSPEMRTLPLTLNVKYFTGKPARSPFLYAEGGYAFRTDADEQHKGLLYEAGIGYRQKLQNRYNFIVFKLGYNGFKARHWRWEKTENGRLNNINEYQWYYLDRPAVNFSVVFYHSTRY